MYVYIIKIYTDISYLNQFVQRVARPSQVHRCFWKGLARNFDESISPFFVRTDTSIYRRIRRPSWSGQKLDFVNGLLSTQAKLVHWNHNNAFNYGRMAFTLVVEGPYNNWCRRSWWYKRFSVCFFKNIHYTFYLRREYYINTPTSLGISCSISLK